MAVPRYDKSLRGGYGDRAPKDTWPVLEGPLQVVLFEGWMLGFKPLGKEAAGAVDPQVRLGGWAGGRGPAGGSADVPRGL